MQPLTNPPGATKQVRILSGMRPTGKLHIGHLMGAIENWKQLQHEYECFFMVADWHALTTAYKHPELIQEQIHDVVLDYLAGGVDPEKCTFYVQSHVPEIAQLHLLLSMVVPVSWLERCPTYKDQVVQLGSDIATYGFLGYPVLMTADIIMFKAQKVPVGQDQVPHLELCRELVRRFNTLYGPVFPEPQPLLTKFPAVPGLDGRKMSKSYDNAIVLSDEPAEIERKMKTAITDPGKVYRRDPGRPEICTVYYYHRLYSGADQQAEVFSGCHAGTLGCVDCKKRAAASMIGFLAPLQERRRALAAQPDLIPAMLDKGARKAREVATRTLDEARQAMGMGSLPSHTRFGPGA